MSKIDLYNGDCLELMKSIQDKSVDMILCDLPYGTTACKWDSIIPFETLWEQYNRVIKDLNGMTKEEFLNKLDEKFVITKSENNAPVKPYKKHTFGMDIENEWYMLEAKPGTFDEDDPIDQLDVAILQNNVLTPILGIEDVRTSDRIDFIGGIRGIKELEKRVNSDMKIAFSMYPTEVHDIMDVADIGEVMPPKSTWFEPKLRSGLFIHKLS